MLALLRNYEREEEGVGEMSKKKINKK